MQILMKLKILYLMLVSAYEGWVSEILHKDLNDNYCCDGRDCSCGGASIKEMWTTYYK